MPRHLPPKNVQDDDTIVLFLRSMFCETITVELVNGMEYSGVLTDLSSDRLGKKVWITLQHVTARSQVHQFIFLKPTPKPTHLLPTPPVDTNASVEIQAIQTQWPLVRKIVNFDYAKFIPLPHDQQQRIVEQLQQQELYDYESYQEYGQYLSETLLEFKNISKFHFPGNIDLLHHAQSYINRLQQLKRRETKGKGQRKGAKDEAMILQLQQQYPDLHDEIETIVRSKDNVTTKGKRQHKQQPQQQSGQPDRNSDNNNTTQPRAAEKRKAPIKLQSVESIQDYGFDGDDEQYYSIRPNPYHGHIDSSQSGSEDSDDDNYHVSINDNSTKMGDP